MAYANATSSAQLAALHPESGGTYVYARERLGSYWGFFAGWSFVVGKTASLSAMALTFGAYVNAELMRPIGIAAVVALTAVNYRGVQKTARLTQVIVAIVLAAPAGVVAATVFGGASEVANLTGGSPGGLFGVLQSGGLLFFAFAGYARLATLGEEVRDPKTTIPRAIPIALWLVVGIYAVVLTDALLAIGADTLANAPAPLAAAVEAGRWSALEPLVSIGAAVASAGVTAAVIVCAIVVRGPAGRDRVQLLRGPDLLRPHQRLRLDLVGHRTSMATLARGAGSRTLCGARVHPAPRCHHRRTRTAGRGVTGVDHHPEPTPVVGRTPRRVRRTCR